MKHFYNNTSTVHIAELRLLYFGGNKKAPEKQNENSDESTEVQDLVSPAVDSAAKVVSIAMSIDDEGTQKIVLETVNTIAAKNKEEELQKNLQALGLPGESILYELQTMYPNDKESPAYLLHVRELEKAANASVDWAVLPGYGISYSQQVPYMYKLDVSTSRLLAYAPGVYQELDLSTAKWSDAEIPGNLQEIYDGLPGKDRAEFFVNMQLEQGLKGNTDLKEIAKNIDVWTLQNTPMLLQMGYENPKEKLKQLESLAGNKVETLLSLLVSNNGESGIENVLLGLNETLNNTNDIEETLVQQWLASKGIPGTHGKYTLAVEGKTISYQGIEKDNLPNIAEKYKKLEEALGNYAADFVSGLKNGNEAAADAAQAFFNEQLVTVQGVLEKTVEDWLATKGIANTLQIGEYIVHVVDGNISYALVEKQRNTPTEEPEPKATKAPEDPEQMDTELEKLVKLLQKLIELLQEPTDQPEKPKPPESPEEPNELLQLRAEEKVSAEELAGLESERKEAVEQHENLLQNTVPLTANTLDNLNRIDDKIIAADAAIAKLKKKLKAVRANISQLETGIHDIEESVDGPIPNEQLQEMTIEELRAEITSQRKLEQKMMKRIETLETATDRSQAVLQKITDTIDQLERALRIKEASPGNSKEELLQALLIDEKIQAELLSNNEVLFTFTTALTGEQQEALQAFATFMPSILSQLSQNGSTITINPAEAFWSTDNKGIAMRESAVAVLQYVSQYNGTVKEIVSRLKKITVV